MRHVVHDVAERFATIICVNDCSTDDSAAELAVTSAFHIEHPINMGQGAALQTGIEFARSLPGIRYVATFDADGQHRVADLEALVDAIESAGTDFALGSRFLDGRPLAVPLSKRLLLRAAVIFSNITSGVKLTDTHNGLRVFTKAVADAIHLTIPDMGHASEFLEIIRRQRYSYIEVPVQVQYTAYSRTKGQQTINAVNIAFDVVLRRFSR